MLLWQWKMVLLLDYWDQMVSVEIILGAGKTTLISILTGLYPPSSGDAYLAGYHLATEMDQVHRNIGVCPQHDILWDDLTVSEHLYFYARLKGTTPNEETQVVNEAISNVGLDNFRNRLSKVLSGGEKRRLSIAIALIGNPRVVFLDEPTTGLDPEVRRVIWTIINKARVGKTIILVSIQFNVRLHTQWKKQMFCVKELELWLKDI
jgi:ABC-type multidrug transport system ATPase subunit